MLRFRLLLRRVALFNAVFGLALLGCGISAKRGEPEFGLDVLSSAEEVLFKKGEDRVLPNPLEVRRPSTRHEVGGADRDVVAAYARVERLQEISCFLAVAMGSEPRAKHVGYRGLAGKKGTK